MNPSVHSSHLGRSSSALDGTVPAPPDDDDNDEVKHRL